MPLDAKVEIEKLREMYKNDSLQHRFSALITGETGSGKTYLLRTCRKPVLLDSFDPGGTKCLREEIAKGDIIADTRWEKEDPFKPARFADWKREIEHRISGGFFNNFGTYALDSTTTWADAVMGKQLLEAKRPGEAPKWSKDYTPQKIDMVNYIKKLMNLPCDFILTGHLKMIEEVIGEYDDGSPKKRIKHRFLAVGQASVTIPLLFDELYVLKTKDSSHGLERVLMTEAQGAYIARSRLKADKKLKDEEPADIKALLKKIGLPWEDLPRL